LNPLCRFSLAVKMRGFCSGIVCGDVPPTPQAREATLSLCLCRKILASTGKVKKSRGTWKKTIRQPNAAGSFHKQSFSFFEVAQSTTHNALECNLVLSVPLLIGRKFRCLLIDSILKDRKYPFESMRFPRQPTAA